MVEPIHLKNIRQNGFIFPNFRGENKTCLKPPGHQKSRNFLEVFGSIYLLSGNHPLLPTEDQMTQRVGPRDRGQKDVRQQLQLTDPLTAQGPTY